MGILQKAYNSITQIITFELFKRKFNAWFENKEVNILSSIAAKETNIAESLAAGNFCSAYHHFIDAENFKKDLKQLSDFKNFVLKKSNKTDEN